MKGISGLTNIGNTCFMNTALQCLSHIPELQDLFLNRKIHEYKNTKRDENTKEKEVTHQWVRLLTGLVKDVEESKQKTIRPMSFFKSFMTYVISKNIQQFRGFSQNDVQEFIVVLMDIIHMACSRTVNINIKGIPKTDLDKQAVEAGKTWKNYFKSQYSEIISIFYGQLCSTLYHSETNEAISHAYDPICHFPLPIPCSETTGLSQEELNEIEPSIYDCFDSFTEEESIEGLEYKWKSKTIEVNKQLKIWSFPKIMMVTLKRFKDGSLKNNTLIDFPLEGLDVSKYCVGYEKDVIYDCIGICNHVGGLHGGHYYAYCLCEDNEWREFNDSHVRTIKKESIVSQNAYVLFYKKR